MLSRLDQNAVSTWRQASLQSFAGKSTPRSRSAAMRPSERVWMGKLLKFREYAVRWFEEQESKRKWKPGTVQAYRTVRARLLEAFGPKQLAHVRPGHVADYLTDLSKQGYSASVVQRDAAVLSAIFKTAKAAELVESNPVEGAELPKQPAFRPPILTPAEVRLILREFTDTWARVLFLTLELTGIRRFEARNLRWRDVDLIENVLKVVDSKSESGVRSIALSSTLAEELWQLRRTSAFAGDDEYVFCHPTLGNPLNPDRYKAKLRAAIEKAGLSERFPEWTKKDVSGRRRGGLRAFHDGRHAAITHDAAAGSSAIAVMTKAGHSSMSTTQRYLHLAGAVFREEADRLEERLLGRSSTDLSESENTSADLGAGGKPEAALSD
jgi:integrase/recombinase XerC